MGQICFGSCFLVGLDSHLLLCVVVDLCAKRSHDFQTLSRQPWLRTFWRLLFQEFVFCKRLIGCFLIHLACIFVTCWACLNDPLHVSRVSDIFDVFGLWCGQSAFNKSLNLAKGAAIWERGQILGEWDFQLLSIRACGTRISLSRYVSVCVYASVCLCLSCFNWLCFIWFLLRWIDAERNVPFCCCPKISVISSSRLLRPKSVWFKLDIIKQNKVTSSNLLVSPFRSTRAWLTPNLLVF